mmetsp:Transcript_36944/g.61245  ORF Transcript_36944/g.61245 Transcript_36944/m.61245 type:complete len:213 (-) Transcript_36944:815-1453(-)
MDIRRRLCSLLRSYTPLGGYSGRCDRASCDAHQRHTGWAAQRDFRQCHRADCVRFRPLARIAAGGPSFTSRLDSVEHFACSRLRVRCRRVAQDAMQVQRCGSPFKHNPASDLHSWIDGTNPAREDRSDDSSWQGRSRHLSRHLGLVVTALLLLHLLPIGYTRDVIRSEKRGCRRGQRGRGGEANTYAQRRASMAGDCDVAHCCTFGESHRRY